MNVIRKITVKAVCGAIDIEKLIAAPDKQIKLARIFGIATKAKPGASDFGEFVKFQGQFRAINLETGAEYQSGGLILPPVAQDFLEGALSGENVESVQFGFDITVRFDNTAIAKYVYEVTPLLEPQENDPLTLLGKTINSLALVDSEKQAVSDKKDGKNK